jgi:hypothetical protein
MHAQQAYLARNRKLDDRVLSKGALAQPPPHKERALWNFLTWSFFIAQVLAAEQFIGAQAKAAENMDLRSSDPSAALAPVKSELASVDSTASNPDDVRQSLGGSLDDPAFQSLKLGQFGGSVIDLDSISVARVEDVSQSISVAGGGMDAGLSPTGDTPGDLLPTSVVDVDIPDILGVIGDVTGPLLDTVDDIVATLTDVVGDIADPLLDTVGSVVHVVDEVLEPVTDLVADITQPLGEVVHDVLTPVTNLVAEITEPLGPILASLEGATSEVTTLLGHSEGITGAAQGVLASAGELIFPLLGVAEPDELYTGGHYTAYNIELQTSAPVSSTVSSVDPIASTTSVVTEVVDHVVEGANKHIAHLIEDLGSRDGLL